MQVICEGYKTCTDCDGCHHKTPHIYTDGCTLSCYENYCVNAKKLERKDKLNNLKNEKILVSKTRIL